MSVFKETDWDRPSRKNCLKEKQNKTSKVVFARVRGLAETGPRLTTGTYAKMSFALYSRRGHTYKEIIPAILARRSLIVGNECFHSTLLLWGFMYVSFKTRRGADFIIVPRVQSAATRCF